MKSGDSLLLWGKKHTLQFIEKNGRSGVRLAHGFALVRVPSMRCFKPAGNVLYKWYLQQLEGRLSTMVPLWEKKMGVQVSRYSVRKMKTRWGSCTPDTSAVRFNIELVRREECFLEYVVVHELAHLIETGHNEKFWSVVSNHLPHWRTLRAELNRQLLPYDYWNSLS